MNVTQEQQQQRHQDQLLSSPVINRSKNNIMLPAYNKTNKPSRIVWQTWVTKELPKGAREQIADMEKANPDYEFR